GYQNVNQIANKQQLTTSIHIISCWMVIVNPNSWNYGFRLAIVSENPNSIERVYCFSLSLSEGYGENIKIQN
ncbi:hypothetical protein, partial [Desulfosporosinus sp. OT]|uniref:hypothetical protein n=1 Tax=Desulfosporosinus sp. OT TaxID=913865 RepID=UPI00058B97C0